MQSETQLSQIIDALNLLRSCFGMKNCRKQKRGENSDYADDDQQFRQRERGILILAAAGHAAVIPHFAFSFNGQHLGCGHGTFAKGD
jgi:hypothetical protein